MPPLVPGLPLNINHVLKKNNNMEIWKRRFINLVCELKNGKEWVDGFDYMQHLVAREFLDSNIDKLAEKKGTNFGEELVDLIDSIIENDDVLCRAVKRDFMY